MWAPWPILACFSIFLAYWLANARKVKATRKRQSVLNEVIHRAPLIIGWVLLFVPHWPSPVDSIVIPTGLASLCVGTAVCAAGLVCAIWARRTLAANWSSSVTLKADHELVERGPYRFVRHPIYTSILTMTVGAAIATGRVSSICGVGAFAVGFAIKLRQEEVVMRTHFGAEYDEYATRVKALIPFIL